MKLRLYLVAFAAIAWSQMGILYSANADTVTLVGQTASASQLNAATSIILAPYSSFGVFQLSTSGNVPNDRVSPFTNPNLDYSVLSDIPNGGRAGDIFDVGRAVYNIAPDDNVFSFLWGSPDAFNTVTFYSGPAGSHGNGTGTVIASFTGADLSKATLGEGYDLVTFDLSGVGSIVFSDDGQSAFEFADVDIDPTPLPAALPLFAGGLVMLGLLGRAKKRGASAVVS
jgi:hypothetical protein